MDTSENVTDVRGEILISYLDSPNFIKASTNAIRLVSKLKLAVQKQELYETQQILRTIYFRFLNNKDKIESLVGLLYHGAQYLLDNSETLSGQDIATLFLEASSKYLQNQLADSLNIGSESRKLNLTQSNPSYHLMNKTLDIDLCQKIANLAIKLPDSEMGRAKFTAEALRLLHPKILNRDLLHTVIAYRYWHNKDYVNARYHYLHCATMDNAHDIATFIVEYQAKSANKSEIDLFITQFIFQFLCLQNPLDSIRNSSQNHATRQSSNNTSSSLATVTRKSRNTIKLIAQKILSTYALKHPQLSHVEVPYSLPLLNFTNFIISILDLNERESDTFKMLCDIYKTTWSRDPNYQSYLNRIGVLYFGQPDQSKQNQQQGGFFNNILMSLLEGADEDDDSNLDGNNTSSSDELD